ncbi:hypothetical protein AVEN_224030-1 [Araneus ventricosus]|uniref:Helitron helicase-like domain-containing protein n=1 Tax=Araneus ventricosus TaxID=182803 RepID=A0A4Y2NGU2_ARAVE|nr:hypothetical protein AVEN_224030-1 [Araneus ventricosus]
MSEVCEFCGALYWKNEVNSGKKYTKCCRDGKVRLSNLTEAPDLFKELLRRNAQETKNYRQHIREYNAALAFASMGLKSRHLLEQAHISSIYMVRFIIWFLLSIQMKETILAMDIVDSSEASNRRMENNQACIHSVMEKLNALLRSINPFAESYLQMHQLI